MKIKEWMWVPFLPPMSAEACNCSCFSRKDCWWSGGTPNADFFYKPPFPDILKSLSSNLQKWLSQCGTQCYPTFSTGEHICLLAQDCWQLLNSNLVTCSLVRIMMVQSAVWWWVRIYCPFQQGLFQEISVTVKSLICPGFKHPTVAPETQTLVLPHTLGVQAPSLNLDWTKSSGEMSQNWTGVLLKRMPALWIGMCQITRHALITVTDCLTFQKSSLP